MGDVTTICYPFAGNTIGGSHISAIKLITGLDHQKYRPIIVLHDDAGPIAEQLTAEGLPFSVAPDVKLMRPGNPPDSASRWEYFTRTLPRLRAFLKQNKIDILHTNDGVIHTNWSPAAKFSGTKHLWHHRADPGAKGINVLAPLFADQIVTVSNFAKPNRPILSVDHKTRAVHSPFDHPTEIPDREQSRLALVDELGCSPDTRFMGYFGGLVERKQPVAFVDAVNAFLSEYPELPVMGLLFGTTFPYEERLDIAVEKRAEELGISDKIHLMGFRQPIEPLMCACDALLVPALNEPFGRTLIEAMFLGTPVVATDHGGNPEAIQDGENGFLVPPRKADAFVKPIHKLLSDPSCWSSISETAMRQARVRFGVEHHVGGITDVYERLQKNSIQPSQSDY
ncbi:MAG: glycosyltransferase family 4 protein [Stappiaceae bacterium]